MLLKQYHDIKNFGGEESQFPPPPPLNETLISSHTVLRMVTRYLNDIPWNGGSLPMTLIPHECAYLEMKFSFSQSRLTYTVSSTESPGQKRLNHLCGLTPRSHKPHTHRSGNEAKVRK